MMAGASSEDQRLEDERLEATIRGVVQGVGFRWFVKRVATRLGVGGWVANASDGTVLVIAEGPVRRLDELERELHAGPPGAVVERVEVQRLPPRGDVRRFEIRAGSHRGD